ncbi:MAG: DinB family protein [Actinomycetota bacterium]|nr:DinB family protein [Actinomycetota bacterium]
MPSRSPAGATAVLLDAFGRTPELVTRALDGLSEPDLTRRVDPDANTVAWLIWHTARMQDGQVAAAEEALGRDAEQVWPSEGFADRFGLDVGDDTVGYGMSSDQVDKVHAPANLLRAYHRAVNDHTLAFVESLDETDYERVVDPGWDPPVTLLARLVSIEQDAVQHLGQAAFLRGVLQRTSG